MKTGAALADRVLCIGSETSARRDLKLAGYDLVEFTGDVSQVRDVDFVYIAGPIDLIAAYIVGAACIRNIPVLSEYRADNPRIDRYIHSSPIEDIQDFLGPRDQLVYSFGTLKEQQLAYSQTCKQFGFDKNTPATLVMLLVEEVGELIEHIEIHQEDEDLIRLLNAAHELSEKARLIRKKHQVSQETGKLSHKEPAGQELADIALYLLHLANALGIDDLGSEMTLKERINAQRNWS